MYGRDSVIPTPGTDSRCVFEYARLAGFRTRRQVAHKNGLSGNAIPYASPGDLLEHWKSRVSGAELEQVQATVNCSCELPIQPTLDNQAALDWAMLHAFERKSVASERELATHALKHGLGTVTPEGVLALIQDHPDLIRRDGKVTTQEVPGEEKRVLDFAIEGRGSCKPFGRQGSETPSFLSDSQAKAIRHIWHSPDRLMLIRGGGDHCGGPSSGEVADGRAGPRDVSSFSVASRNQVRSTVIRSVVHRAFLHLVGLPEAREPATWRADARSGADVRLNCRVDGE
jgi:hypothetical protein